MTTTSKPYGLYVPPLWTEAIVCYGERPNVLGTAVALGFDEKLFDVPCDFTEVRSKEFLLSCQHRVGFAHYALTELYRELDEIHTTFESLEEASGFFRKEVGPIRSEPPSLRNKQTALRFDPQRRSIIDPTHIAPYVCTQRLAYRTQLVYVELTCDRSPYRSGIIYQTIDAEDKVGE